MFLARSTPLAALGEKPLENIEASGPAGCIGVRARRRIQRNSDGEGNEEKE